MNNNNSKKMCIHDNIWAMHDVCESHVYIHFTFEIHMIIC